MATPFVEDLGYAIILIWLLMALLFMSFAITIISALLQNSKGVKIGIGLFVVIGTLLGVLYFIAKKKDNSYTK